MRDDWRSDAACRGYPVGFFYPDAHEHKQQIRNMCEPCPVQRWCAEYAIAHEVLGYWAGLSPADRVRSRAERGIVVDVPQGLEPVEPMPEPERFSSPAMPLPEDPRHGSRSGYVSMRCRCGPCTRANRTYEVGRRQRVRMGAA